MRGPLRWGVAGLAAVVLAACPGTPTPPGDVAYGEYLVTARKRMDDTCHFSEDTTGDTFEFWARLAVDEPPSDGSEQRAYLTLRQPPTGGIEQAPRRGRVEDGALVFEATAQQDLRQCDCIVEVTETIRITLRVAEAGGDGGTPGGDGGSGADGGMADGGSDAGTGAAGDGGTGGAGPASSLPDPSRVIGIGGEIVYAVKDIGACDLEKTQCTLPCGFEYGLTGTRLAGS